MDCGCASTGRFESFYRLPKSLKSWHIPDNETHIDMHNIIIFYRTMASQNLMLHVEILWLGYKFLYPHIFLLLFTHSGLFLRYALSHFCNKYKCESFAQAHSAYAIFMELSWENSIPKIILESQYNN